MSDFEGEGARGVNLLAQKELQTVLSRSVQDITCRFAGIQLWEQECPLSDDICTVYTTFDGGHHAALLLCADTPLLARLARKILHSESVTPEILRMWPQSTLTSFVARWLPAFSRRPVYPPGFTARFFIWAAICPKKSLCLAVF